MALVRTRRRREQRFDIRASRRGKGCGAGVVRPAMPLARRRRRRYVYPNLPFREGRPTACIPLAASALHRDQVHLLILFSARQPACSAACIHDPPSASPTTLLAKPPLRPCGSSRRTHAAGRSVLSTGIMTAEWLPWILSHRPLLALQLPSTHSLCTTPVLIEISFCWRSASI